MKFRLSSTFGELTEVRNGVPHTGIDIPFAEGTILRSVSNGIVEAVRDYGNKNIGKGVVIRDNDGNFHIYGHLQNADVVKGQEISVGDILGATGNTGNSTAPHLHFGIQTPEGTFIDPTQYARSIHDMAGSVEVASSSNIFLDAINGVSDWVVGKQIDLIAKPIGSFFKDVGRDLWGWFIFNLPDMLGYVTILAGALMILSSMSGKGGIVKTAAWYFGMLIIAVLILGGA